MVANLTSDGFVQIRYNSGETLPAKDEWIDGVYDNATKGRVRAMVQQGSEAFEIDTGSVYVMGDITWEVI